MIITGDLPDRKRPIAPPRPRPELHDIAAVGVVLAGIS